MWQGANHSIVICYQPSLGGQGAPLGSTSSVSNLENSGGRTKTLTTDNPRAKWTLTELLLNRWFITVHYQAILYIGPTRHTCPVINLRIQTANDQIRKRDCVQSWNRRTAAQPGQLTITIRMRVSFAAPSLTTN